MGNIVWLASYPKSGSTWLRAFLANLIANRATPLRPDELRDFTDDEARADRYSRLAGRPNTLLSATELASLRPDVHALIASEAQGTHLVKTHNLCGRFEGYPLCNWQVTAGAICVVRNPLDVAISMTHHFGLTVAEAIARLGDERAAIANSAATVGSILGSWSTHVAGWADLAAATPEKVIVLRYEDLLVEPEAQLGRAAELLALGQDRARIARAVQHAGFDVLAALEQRNGFVEAVAGDTPFFYKGRSGQWRDAMTRAQVLQVVARHRTQMQRFDYLPDGY